MPRLMLSAALAAFLAAPAAFAQSGTSPVIIPAPDTGSEMTTRPAPTPATTRSGCGKTRGVMS